MSVSRLALGLVSVSGLELAPGSTLESESGLASGSGQGRRWGRSQHRGQRHGRRRGRRSGRG